MASKSKILTLLTAISLLAASSIPATVASFGGTLSFTDGDLCGFGRVCYGNGSNYYLQVNGAPANQDGIIYKSENGGQEEAISDWIHSDTNGNVTKGPWTCGVSSGEKTSINRIQWADGSETNTIIFVCDTKAPVITIDPSSGPGNFHGTTDDGYGTGFNSWEWSSPYATYRDTVTNRYYSLVAGSYNSTTPDTFTPSMNDWTGQSFSWTESYAPPASAHICGRTYEWEMTVRDIVGMKGTNVINYTPVLGSGCSEPNNSNENLNNNINTNYNTNSVNDNRNTNFNAANRGPGTLSFPTVGVAKHVTAIGRVIVNIGESYYLQVAGGPTNTDGVICKTENGGTEQCISGWIHTDETGSITKGPWTCSETKTSLNYIKWSNGSQTNTVTFICDSSAPVITIDPSSGPGNFHGTTDDGYGTGFNSWEWSSPYATYRDTVTNRYYSLVAGSYNSTTPDTFTPSMNDWTGQSFSWTESYAPPASAHICGRTYEWEMTVRDIVGMKGTNVINYTPVSGSGCTVDTPVTNTPTVSIANAFPGAYAFNGSATDTGPGFDLGTPGNVVAWATFQDTVTNKYYDTMTGEYSAARSDTGTNATVQIPASPRGSSGWPSNAPVYNWAIQYTPGASAQMCGRTYAWTVTVKNAAGTTGSATVNYTPTVGSGCTSETGVTPPSSTLPSEPPVVNPPVSTPPAVEPPVVHPPVQEPPQPPVVTPPADDVPVIQPPAVKQPKSPKLKRRTTADYYN